MTTKPTVLPRWATDAGRTLEPTSGEKDMGWQAGYKPPARKMNWLHNLGYQWVDWLHETVLSLLASRWTQRSPAGGFGNTFYGIASDDSDLLCAVGHGYEIQTSADGITWTQRKTGGGIATYEAVAHDQSGLWVATGYDAADTDCVIWTSPDGTTWTQRTSATTPGLQQFGQAVAHDESALWCIVGDAGVGATALIQTSPDGITWTLRTPAGSFAGSLWGVKHNLTDLWCAVGSSGEIETSPDGTTWTQRTPDASFAGTFYDVAWVASLSLWVTVGSGGEIQTSPDGTTWTQQTAGSGYVGSFRHVTSVDGLAIAVGDSGEIQTSFDGVTWTKRDTAGGYSGSIRSVAASQVLVALCGATAELETTDHIEATGA